MDMLKNNVIVISVTVLLVATLTAFTWVLVTGSDTSKLVDFFKWGVTIVPVVAMWIMNAKNNATISNQIASVGTGVTNVEHATNGVLKAQFEGLKAHIDNAVANVTVQSSAVVTDGIPDLTTPTPDYTHTVNVIN